MSDSLPDTIARSLSTLTLQLVEASKFLDIVKRGRPEADGIARLIHTSA